MVTIPAQFNGPDHSGNGGYVAGMLAAESGGGPVTATLRQPPPLDVALSWERDGDMVRLLTAGGAVVGEAAPGAFVRDAPALPALDQAAAGREAYPGFHLHPFARCFTCGTARDEGDGLRLFAGPIGGDRTAGTWTPHEAFGHEDGLLDLPTTWAALDCPGGWAADFTQQTMLLGRMTAEVVRRPRAGEPHVAVGQLSGRDGRKFFTDTALYTEGGELLGRAEQVWITVGGPAAS
ncbi:MAG: hypothetical protein JWP31_742 [Aeromicrobium sp.]|nr:hypothetical protein [Aeromicrobium sp.]